MGAIHSAACGASVANAILEDGRMNWSFGRRPTIAFALIFGVLVVDGAVDYWHTARLRKQGEMSARAHEFRSELEAMFSTLMDAEIAKRDYVISGEARYLEPCRLAIGTFDTQMKRIGELTVGEPLDDRLTSIESATRARLEDIQATIALRQTEGFDAARRHILAEQSGKEIDWIQELAGRIRREESDRRADRSRAATFNYVIAQTAAGAGLLLGLMIVGLAYYLTGHELTARTRAEGELRQLTQTLEQRVEERTEALQMLHDIASMANQAQNPEQAIEYCLRRVAVDKKWCFGHALLPATDNPEELVPAYFHYAEAPQRFRRFREATLGIRLRRGQCLPGRVFAGGKPEWTKDVRRDLVERRAVVAEELGIGTAVAFPVLVGEKVAAVLEFFSDRDIQPDGRITDAMVGVGMQLGRVIERAGFEEHLLTIAEQIQRDIAQDLHDDVGQELTGLGLKAATLAEMLAPSKTPAGKLAANIAAAVDRTHDKVRGLTRGLLPVELEEGLLAEALGQLVAATTEGSRVACKLDCFHPDPVFDSRVSVHLYRIAQEAVSNAVRHSGAQSIRISLDQKSGEAALTIQDDGTGLSIKAANTGGMGLRTMRYRAGLISAKLEVGPAPGGGMQVICRLATPRNYEAQRVVGDEADGY
jgi:signal transduction histidine kinase